MRHGYFLTIFHPLHATSHVNVRAGEVFYQCPFCTTYNLLHDIGKPITIRKSICERCHSNILID